LIVTCTVAFLCCFGLAFARSEDVLGFLRHSWLYLDDPQILVEAGGLAAARVWLDGEWWRLGTANLLHSGWLHLGLNMLALWSVGQWTEKVWGAWRQLILFTVSGIGGCLASLAWAEAPMVVGASAGIFGIAGALVVARAFGRDSVKQGLEPVSARTLAFWLVFWLVVGASLPFLLGFSVLAQAGHLGGLVFGVLTGVVFGVEKRVWRWSSVVAACAGIAWIWRASIAPEWRANYHVILASEWLERDAYVEAAREFELGLAGREDDPQLANGVAYALAEAGVELERAEVLVGRALAADAGNADYLDTLGWIRCKQGRVEGGLVLLRLAEGMAERETPEISEHIRECASVSGG
jgi:membrane associated rhomboid family serine protease